MKINITANTLTIPENIEDDSQTNDESQGTKDAKGCCGNWQEQRTINLRKGLAAILAGHTRPEGANMKTATTALLGMFAICGIVVAGCDTENFLFQVFISTGGALLFGAALLAITFVQGGE